MSYSPPFSAWRWALIKQAAEAEAEQAAPELELANVERQQAAAERLFKAEKAGWVPMTVAERLQYLAAWQADAERADAARKGLPYEALDASGSLQTPEQPQRLPAHIVADAKERQKAREAAKPATKADVEAVEARVDRRLSLIERLRRRY